MKQKMATETFDSIKHEKNVSKQKFFYGAKKVVKAFICGKKRKPFCPQNWTKTLF